MKYLILLSAFLFVACSTTKKISNIRNDGLIVHFVLLSVGDRNNIGLVIESIKSLKAISYVQSFEVGEFLELNDKRAYSEYEVIIKMEFNDRADFELYQIDKQHTSLKEKLKPFFDRPPVTYHYQIR